MVGRYRNKKMNVSLSKDELDDLKYKVEQSEFKSRQAYIISLLHKVSERADIRKSTVIDFSYYYSKLNEIGNEINDIARLCNMTMNLDTERYKIVVEKLNNITNELVSKIG